MTVTAGEIENEIVSKQEINTDWTDETSFIV